MLDLYPNIPLPLLIVYDLGVFPFRFITCFLSVGMERGVGMFFRFNGIGGGTGQVGLSL